MSKVWDSRDGTPTAVSTETALDQRGGDGTAGRIQVPANATEISDVLVVAASNLAATGANGAIVRIRGGGLPFGEESFSAHGSGVQTATGNYRSVLVRRYSWPEGKGIKVTPGNSIDAFCEMTTADTGELFVGLSLAFRVAG